MTSFKHEGSVKTGTEPCPKCGPEDGAGDNLVRFDDGHGYCFACHEYYPADGTRPVESEVRHEADDWTPIKGKVDELAHRGISKSVCRLYGYRRAKVRGQYMEVANYIKDGVLVGQHVRIQKQKSKDFFWAGEKAKSGLFGQHLWKKGGRRIIVTEGEIDCMTVYQTLGSKWPVVSIPCGSADAANAIRAALEFLSSYSEIVLCFDMDKPGQEALIECADILPPGKVKLVHLPRKDANAMLLKNESSLLLNCLWEAQAYRPDGIIHVSDVDGESQKGRSIWPLPWRSLTQGLSGQRSHELTMWTSGTGMGKSTVLRHIIHHHLLHGRTVGVCMMEEDVCETLDDLISLELAKPVRQIRAARELNTALEEYGEEPIDFGVTDDLTDTEYTAAKEKIQACPLYFYDHRGANDYDGILAKIEYMVVALGCQVVVLDHVTAVIAGQTDFRGGERRGIDELMGQLRSLVSRTGVHLDVVSQLKKPDGKPFEEGGQISSVHLRGSGSLASVPNQIVAIERNQQAVDKKMANTIVVRVLKGRFNGRTGRIAALQYNTQTGLLEEVEWSVDAEGEMVFGSDEYLEGDSEDVGDFLDDTGAPDCGAAGGSSHADPDDVRSAGCEQGLRAGA